MSIIAVNNEFRDINLPLIKFDRFNRHFDWLHEKCGPIANFFYSGEGFKPLYVDGQMTEIIIREPARQGKIDLP